MTSISYWECANGDYEEINGEPIYRCIHPNGEGFCSLDNKLDNRKAVCDLLAKKEEL